AKFDRKNYHYPDLMKGYQISQYDLPLSLNGYLNIEVAGEIKRIGIRRVHLEEDTAKSFHIDGSSFIDVNRAGVPLMEIVSEPDLHSLEAVKQYSESLRQVLRYLNVSTGDMEKGAMRFEANISLRPAGSPELSKTRVEVKNLNSFRSMVRAVEYEIARQEEILRAGGVVEQETMGWDDTHNTTITQRSKEEANDYRYFPEPDLPRLEISRSWVEEIRAALPELPDEKRKRYVSELELTPYDAGVITAEKEIADYFDSAVKFARAHGVEPNAVAHWLTSDLFGLIKNANIGIRDVPVSPERLVGLLELINKGTISTTIAKTLLPLMMESGRGAAEIAAEKGLVQVTDPSAIDSLVDKVLAANPEPVAQFKNGKTGALQFIIGQVMKESKGQAKPDLVRDVVLEKLKSHNGV
ncbi:MAG TPA: Asp-tRNA(Asn)/Glu-tRNA(Gln) amidotransferase subunit GatB, partial [Anaerolineae bacterium]